MENFETILWRYGSSWRGDSIYLILNMDVLFIDDFCFLASRILHHSFVWVIPSALGRLIWKKGNLTCWWFWLGRHVSMCTFLLCFWAKWLSFGLLGLCSLFYFCGSLCLCCHNLNSPWPRDENENSQCSVLNPHPLYFKRSHGDSHVVSFYLNSCWLACLAVGISLTQIYLLFCFCFFL